MATKKHLFRFGSFAIKDGSEIRFWEDIWLGNASLREQYLALYNIARDKNNTICSSAQLIPAKYFVEAGFDWHPTNVME